MRIQDLDPSEARNVAALLDEELALPADEHAPWQAELANREPQLCDLVAELLASIAESRKFSDDLGPLEPTLLSRALTWMSRDVATPEGRRFGPYRALRLLGRGGMGSVWLAERADGMFERQVALKLMHTALLGGMSHEHFARESRILGALDHPLIARLHDVGVTPDGQPYLALEYIEGTSITEYSDAHRLSLMARVALMTQVLAAVQHAHQNLVIHRDLKPANILVGRDGRARLLDFGIAKLMNDHTGETTLTQQGMRALTPNYASPEQIAGKPVSTASDVYSLGVILYTLLSGQRPYNLQGDSHLALEAVMGASSLRRPSQQIATAAIAEARSTTPKKLAQALTGDLDTIVLKAMKREPGERYATADAMLQDLQRFLTGQPIQARPDSAFYRFAKLVKRNQARVAVGSAVVAALFAAAGVSIWEGRVARRQEAVAQREAQRAKVVQDLLVKIFKTNSVLQGDPIRARQTTARELLDVGATLAAESLEGSPEAQQEVLDTLSDMYFQLGLHEEAARMRQHRIRSLQRAYGSNDLRVAGALADFADDVSNSMQRAEAEAALAEARRILDTIADDATDASLRAVARASGAPPLLIDETRAKLLLAHIRLLQGRPQEAAVLAQAAIDHVQSSALRERVPALDAEAHLRLGQAQQRAGNPGSARVQLARALSLRDATDAPNSPWLAEAQIALADCLLDLGEKKAAHGLIEKAQAAHSARGELSEQFRAPLRAILARVTTR